MCIQLCKKHIRGQINPNQLKKVSLHLCCRSTNRLVHETVIIDTHTYLSIYLFGVLIDLINFPLSALLICFDPYILVFIFYELN